MILKVENLSVMLKKDSKPILKNVNFEIEENHCLGILGESGSGKSMTWKAFTGMLSSKFLVSGNVDFKGSNLLNLNPKDQREIRGHDISIIVQNPMTAFDPLFTVGSQMSETFSTHSHMNKKEASLLAIDILQRMRIENPEDVLKKYPHELSGGMCQRIMIGISIALNPSLIIADEPTTAIDSINQHEILKEFEILKKQYKLSMIFISHDLNVLSRIADTILVMSNGEVIETGSVNKIIKNPEKEETKFLVNTHIKLIDEYNKCISREALYC